MFPALQHRNFRLLWIGLLISFTGTLMQTAAILWHVSLLAPDDRRALASGMVGLVRVVPVVRLFAPQRRGGRRPRSATPDAHHAVSDGRLAAVLAILTWRGLSTLWPIYLIAAGSSAAGAFDLPARQALVPPTSSRRAPANALTLNTIMFQVASVAGPALGGVVIAPVGVAWVYAVNAVSFLFVIGALLMMRMRKTDAGPPEPPTAPVRGTSRRRGARGAAIRVPRAAHPLDDAARFLRDVLLVGDGAAADLRTGRASRRRRGYGWLYAAPRSAPSSRARPDDPRRRLIERRGSRAPHRRRRLRAATIVFGVSRTFC